MALRVAVVADAVSRKFVFPYFYRYYGRQFGFENIYLITYLGLSKQFEDFKLGGLIELPVGYDNEVRRRFITDMANSLLSLYDVIIRVDVDEILVVDPRRSGSLSEFLQETDAPYFTARGFDVVQLLNEPAIKSDPTVPSLSDRQYAYPNTALNKTSISRVPIQWSPGFHFASVYPKFGPLFMLHLKRVDITWQIGVLSMMSDSMNGNHLASGTVKDRYRPDEQQIIDYHSKISDRRRLNGLDSWYREELTHKYLTNVKYSMTSGLYNSNYGHELVLCEIPREWKSII